MASIKRIQRVLLAGFAFLLGTSARAEETISPTEVKAQAEDASTDLNKKLQNPVSSLISVPLQFNFNFKTGPFDRAQFLFNFQPVIPFHLAGEWSIITRTILPILVQPVDQTDTDFGLGDMQESLFFARSWGIFTMGLGPIFLFPTATNETLGTGKLGIGPTGVFVLTTGPIVAGVLINNIFSVAGDPDRAGVNQALIQPFLNYNLKKGWALSIINSQIVANWKEPNDQRWLVPIGFGFSKTFVAGKQPMNAGANMYYNVIRPDNGPDWQLRFNLTLIFPKN